MSYFSSKPEMTFLSLSFRSAHADLLFYKLCYMLHSDRGVFLRIECIRIFTQVFFYAVAECDAQLCRKVYFTDTAFDGFAYRVVRNSGSAVEYERDGYDLTDLAQAVKIQLRSAFIKSVCCSDGNGKRCNACALYKFLCLLWICVRIVVAAIKIVLFSADLSKLSFHADA